ncbi:sensor histidine kinase [Poseidonibacter lekithochrous]|uniref:sensor histidine kinase n=1 Tax=Poseidonibacter lekithochrous TaxID=1904463 RepID=UPI0008FCC3BE|nr:HAMP domain-containing sensor histidine kinase [Poseidonibacter lekithochrous]
MNTQYNSTLNQLIFLISTFLIGIFLLISIHIIFLNLMEKLDKQTINLKAKIQIGELIVNDLYKVRSDFYELATTATNKKSKQLIFDKINKKIKDIRTTLDVLNNSGTVKRTIRLNIAEHYTSTKEIHYKRINNEFSLETIDLEPKLLQLEGMINKLLIILKKEEVYKRNSDAKNYMFVNKEIKRFYKSTPAFFMRITENTNRLLYEGSIELKTLEKRIKEQKEQYINIELFLVFVIIVLVIILGFVIAKQINGNSRKLEHQRASTRGILDGQQNIVVVSNGEEMIDANSTLVDFFEGYNTFDDFRREHLCICDFFIDVDNPEFLIDIDYDGLKWFEYILANPTLPHKVVMMQGENKRYFSITAKKKDLDDKDFIVIISLNDISTEIESRRELKRLNDNLEDIVNEKTKEFQELNETLELKVEKGILENREKDKKLIQQTRFAALGEMIGNIAHQWRQPLSAISSTASSMLLQLQLDLLEKKDIEKSYNSIIKYSDFLSQTVEDFRSFFKENKQKEEFDMIKTLHNTITITSATYKDAAIQIAYNFDVEELYAYGFANELSQVYLNILSNAKDILKNSEDQNKIVKIRAYENDNFNVVEIIDNAGGINEEIIDKIFDPYFTTKHQSQGTGIGLYMSKEIIEKHMSGQLTAHNTKFKFQSKEYIGACFKIELPRL